MASKVKVAVRVRPANKRERKIGAKPCIAMQGTQTVLTNPMDSHKKTFNFDHSFWSSNLDDPHFVDQDVVFNELGTDVLDNAFGGYNACIFAYGQTGSGKTYTMMGVDENKGIIPRLCDDIFERIQASTDSNLSFKVEVSYMEIYNERVQDLLSSNAGKKKKKNLRVREHKILGPYVEGLSKLAVTGYDAIATLMAEGNKSRTTAATLMNDTSSRSHAVFTLILTQAQYDTATKQTGEKAARISLVDLAGSERHSKTGTSGARLKEGANINKSLTTLGLVISALADRSGSSKKKFIPYRDSVLTWLLKDNLGGNSKTVMVATISPSGDNFEETLSTLRYADRAKQIVNHAVVNEDPNARLIRELREELERLRAEFGGTTGGGGNDEEVALLKTRLAETEGFIAEMTTSWEEKLKTTEAVLKEKQELLDSHSASVTGASNSLKVESKLPHFISLSDDPLAAEITIYTFKEGLTTFGREDSEPANDIVVWGIGTEAHHCVIEHTVEHDTELNCLIEVVTLEPLAELCLVDGQPVGEKTRLRQGNVVQLGHTNMYRFNHPTEAKRLRKLGQTAGGGAHSMSVFNPSRNLEMQHLEREKKLSAEKAAIEEQKQRLMMESEKHAELMRQREEEQRLMEAQAAQREEEDRARRELQDMEMREKEAKEREAREAREKENEDLRQRLAELEAKMKEDAQRADQERIQREQLEKLAEEQRVVEQERMKKMEELERSAMAEAEKARRLAEMKEMQEKSAEEQRQRMEELLAKQEQERLKREEEQRLEAERRLMEAEDKLAAEVARQEEAQRKLQETEDRLRQEEERARAERIKQEQIERIAREQALSDQQARLEQERGRQLKLQEQLAAARAQLQEDSARAQQLATRLAETEQMRLEEKSQIEQEKLEDQRRIQEESERKLQEAENKLAEQERKVEAERRKREQAEELARQERTRRELEEASTEKMMAEKDIVEQKKKKQLARAKEEWMKRLGASSDEDKLKRHLREDDQLTAEEEAELMDLRKTELEKEKAEKEERAKEYKKRVEAAKAARLEAAKAAERMEELKRLRAKIRDNDSKKNDDVDMEMEKQVLQLSMQDASPDRKGLRRSSSQTSFNPGAPPSAQPSGPVSTASSASELPVAASISRVQPPQATNVAMAGGPSGNIAQPAISQPQQQREQSSHRGSWSASDVASPPQSPAPKADTFADLLPRKSSSARPVPAGGGKNSRQSSSGSVELSSSPNPFASEDLGDAANPFASAKPSASPDSNPFGTPAAATAAASSSSRAGRAKGAPASKQGSSSALPGSKSAPFSKQSSSSSISSRASMTEGAFADLVPDTLTRRKSQTRPDAAVPVRSKPMMSMVQPQPGQHKQPQQPQQARGRAPGARAQQRKAGPGAGPGPGPGRAAQGPQQQDAFAPQPPQRGVPLAPGGLAGVSPKKPLTAAQLADLKKQQMAEAAVKMMQAQEAFVAKKRKNGQPEKDKGLFSSGAMQSIMKQGTKFMKHGKQSQ